MSRSYYKKMKNLLFLNLFSVPHNIHLNFEIFLNMFCKTINLGFRMNTINNQNSRSFRGKKQILKPDLKVLIHLYKFNGRAYEYNL